MKIDGKKLKLEEGKKLAQEIEILPEKLRLSIILVGNNQASQRYVDHKLKFAQSLGIQTELIHLTKELKSTDLIKIINRLNADDSVNGIIVQLPLPETIDETEILDKIAWQKDIDGFTSYSISRLFRNQPTLLPCTVRGIEIILKSIDFDLVGKNVCIAGRSNIVGKPLALHLTNLGATVTLCHSKTKDIKSIIARSDLFVSAIGQGHYFTEEYFEDVPEIVVIDVGTNFTKDNKLQGDVDYLNVINKVRAITPVPGGVGQLTVYGVMENLLYAYKLQKGEK